MYLKTTYQNDPIFQHTKSVFTVYNNYFPHKFNDGLIEKVKMIDIEDSMLSHLESGDFEGFIKIGIQYADEVIKTGENFSDSLLKLFDQFEEKKIATIEKDTDYLESYYNLYHDLAG